MKKKIYGALLFLLVIGIGYSSVWIRSYNQAKSYYISAMNNYNQGNLSIALKGDFVKNTDSSGYTYIGGFQQADEIFESEFAIPKPSITKEAEHMADRIISEMDIKTCQQTFSAYFGKDNRYLPEILIRVGDIHLSEGDVKDAKEAYTMVVEAFKRHEDAYNIALEKLEALND